jgi:hypothetical protein
MVQFARMTQVYEGIGNTNLVVWDAEKVLKRGRSKKEGVWRGVWEDGTVCQVYKGIVTR